MVYSKERILLQSATERGEKPHSNPFLSLSESLEHLTSRERSWGGEGGAPPPRRRVPLGRQDERQRGHRKERETNGAGAVLPQAGRCAWSSGAGRTSLSSSPWIQKASGVLAQSGLPSDSGRDKRQRALGHGQASGAQRGSDAQAKETWQRGMGSLAED